MKWAAEGKKHADAILVNLGLNNVEARQDLDHPARRHLRVVPRQVP